MKWFVNKFDLHTVPVKVNISLEQSQFPENSDINIPCAVDGYPIPRVIWYKNDKPIRPDNRIEISGKRNKRVFKTNLMKIKLRNVW